jgi:hypothetical protein
MIIVAAALLIGFVRGYGVRARISRRRREEYRRNTEDAIASDTPFEQGKAPGLRLPFVASRWLRTGRPEDRPFCMAQG